jgi:hypothetical protein
MAPYSRMFQHSLDHTRSHMHATDTVKQYSLQHCQITIPALGTTQPGLFPRGKAAKA